MMCSVNLIGDQRQRTRQGLRMTKCRMQVVIVTVVAKHPAPVAHVIIRKSGSPDPFAESRLVGEQRRARSCACLAQTIRKGVSQRFHDTAVVNSTTLPTGSALDLSKLPLTVRRPVEKTFCRAREPLMKNSGTSIPFGRIGASLVSREFLIESLTPRLFSPSAVLHYCAISSQTTTISAR